MGMVISMNVRTAQSSIVGALCEAPLSTLEPLFAYTTMALQGFVPDICLTFAGSMAMRLLKIKMSIAVHLDWLFWGVFLAGPDEEPHFCDQ